MLVGLFDLVAALAQEFCFLDLVLASVFRFGLCQLCLFDNKHFCLCLHFWDPKRYLVRSEPDGVFFSV